MPRDVTGRGSWKEEFQALFFVMVFVIPIALIGTVEARWETTTTEEVWVSDGDAIIPHYPYKYDDGVLSYEGNWTTTTRTLESGVPNKYYLNDSTSLYSGNDTWIDSFGVINSDGSADVKQIFEIPDADEFLINEVTVRLWAGGSSPDKLNIFLAVVNLDGKINQDVDPAKHDILASHTVASIALPSDYVNDTYQIGLANALDIYDKAQLDNTKVYLTITQIFFTGGIPLHSESWSASINGTYQKGLSASDIVYYMLGFSATMNVIIGLIMTDQIDLPKPKKVRRG